jgi:mono/diheme cytochrome c family protein
MNPRPYPLPVPVRRSRSAACLLALAVTANAACAAFGVHRADSGSGHLHPHPGTVAKTSGHTSTVTERLASIRLDLLDPANADGNALALVSEESSLGSHLRIENRIRMVSFEHFDLWLMRQRQGDADTPAPAHWSLVAIVVDKPTAEMGASVAHYMEFTREPLVAGKNPVLAPMTAPCLNCHASGPRVIRPTSASLNDMTERDKNMLAQYNRTVRSYANLRNAERPGTLPREATASARQPLLLPRCAGCHSDASAIRGPLFPWQRDTINFMTTARHDAAAMPPSGPALTAAEHAELQHWSGSFDSM